MKTTKVLAVASGGGHWVQLLRLRAAWSDCQASYVTVQPDYAVDVPSADFHRVTDATRWDRLRLAWMVLQVAWVILRLRPDVVITTGAAPGVAALRVAK